MPGALQSPIPTGAADPGALLRCWPAASPLAAIWSGRPGRRRITLARPAGPEAWIFPADLAELERAWAEARARGSLLLGFLSYDLGQRIEPAAAGPPAGLGVGQAGIGGGAKDAGGADGARAWPAIGFVRCEARAVFEDGRWSGNLEAPGRAAAVERSPSEPLTSEQVSGAFSVEALRSRTGQPRYVRDVGRVIERIRAGDVYQVNLAHELVGGFRGSARALFAQVAAATDPWHGAYLEVPGQTRRALCSFSPEQFLEYDAASRRIVTRPMKGTRPGAGDPAELEAAPKDTAELNMIIDLMRNDLGRSCAFGSIEVERGRAIERHGAGAGAVLQATGEISGRLRPEVSFLEALGRAFPPGSVTGAPKIQAMRMIEALEPGARGPYCGAIGELRPDGSASFSVAIRTALVTERAVRAAGGVDRRSAAGPSDQPGYFQDAELSYSVGAGIVADSDPEAEWQETLDKAAMLASAAGARIEP